MAKNNDGKHSVADYISLRRQCICTKVYGVYSIEDAEELEDIGKNNLKKGYSSLAYTFIHHVVHSCIVALWGKGQMVEDGIHNRTTCQTSSISALSSEQSKNKTTCKS